MNPANPESFWPERSASSSFVSRRRRLAEQLVGPALVVAGFSRPKNFPHNRHPFRAESHFLYLVGRNLEGAALWIEPGKVTLYASEPDPDDAMWSGPRPSLAELSQELELEVRPIEELAPSGQVATLPPQDSDTAAWLSELLDRDVEPGAGSEVEGIDLALAEAMIELRLRHDAAAVEQLRQAARVTERAHLAGMAATRPGMREARIRAAMEAEIIGSGMSCSYNSIVSVHGEVLHNESYAHLVGPNDLVLADVGAETPEGFAGDVTRTWPASGKFSPTQRAVYEIVLAAQRAAIDAVGPGVRYRDVHRAAGRTLMEGLIELGLFKGSVSELYERGAAALFFPHGVGHLLGADVHDMEDLGDRAGYAPGRQRSQRRGDRFLRLDRDLEPGMAVTIEPGFYQIDAMLNDPEELGDLAGELRREALERVADVRGIRIEDDVLVTASGCEVLTPGVPKAVAEVEAAVRG